MTPAGEVAIEDIQIGDLVQTMRGEAMAVKWIGRHFYKRSGSSWNAKVVPVRVARHALDQATPHTDLYLSPGHSLFIDGAFIRVQDLVNGTSIAAVAPVGREIEYFHIVLDTHEVILAEGAAAETFLVRGSDHENFTNFIEFTRLHSGTQPPAMVPFAPVVGYGGRKHLKALLRLGLRRFIPSRAPAPQDIYERIAARGEQMAR
jgi:hypothetical protein